MPSPDILHDVFSASRSRTLWVLFTALSAVLVTAWMPTGDATADSDANTEAAAPSFPSTVVDIEGKLIDVQALAESHNLVVVTLKATWCPVCQRQLERLKQRLHDLQQCRVTFIVLAPGPKAELAKIRERTGFEFPFVEDRNLEIARSLGLDRGADQIFPCMFEILPNLEIGWTQFGRNGAYFGDGELTDYFDCTFI